MVVCLSMYTFFFFFFVWKFWTYRTKYRLIKNGKRFVYVCIFVIGSFCIELNWIELKIGCFIFAVPPSLFCALRVLDPIYGPHIHTFGRSILDRFPPIPLEIRKSFFFFFFKIQFFFSLKNWSHNSSFGHISGNSGFYTVKPHQVDTYEFFFLFVISCLPRFD